MGQVLKPGNLALRLSSATHCLTLNELLTLCEPPFCHLSNGDNLSFIYFLWEEGGGFGDHRKYVCVHAKSLQSCPTPCNAGDRSLPGSSVRGILQARVLEWVAMPSSGGSSQPRDQTQVSYVFCIGRLVLYH